MIAHRPAAALGSTDLGWIRARHHFRFAGAQNVDLLHWGSLRVVNHNILAPDAATTPVAHHGTEVLYIVEDGAIDLVRENGARTRVSAGQTASAYTGSGLHFSIANPLAVAAVVTELWLTCQGPHQPALVRRVARDKRWETLVIGGPEIGTGVFRLQCPAIVTRHFIASGDDAEMGGTAGQSYAFLLRGACRHDEGRLSRHDGVAIRGNRALAVTAREDTDLVLVEMFG